jgi:hypothetical protein
MCRLFLRILDKVEFEIDYSSENFYSKEALISLSLTLWCASLLIRSLMNYICTWFNFYKRPRLSLMRDLRSHISSFYKLSHFSIFLLPILICRCSIDNDSLGYYSALLIAELILFSFVFTIGESAEVDAVSNEAYRIDVKWAGTYTGAICASWHDSSLLLDIMSYDSNRSSYHALMSCFLSIWPWWLVIYNLSWSTLKELCSAIILIKEYIYLFIIDF